MSNIILLEAFHGTDMKYVENIIKHGFLCKQNDSHWLGNGIYFYLDYSLANWWTTNPTNKFGVKITDAAIIKCQIEVSENDILDLRKLSDYQTFVNIYRDDFLPFLQEGSLKNANHKNHYVNIKKLRCTYCDYLNLYYNYKMIIGTFHLPKQPYMPSKYGKLYRKFDICYIESQICIFDQSIIINKVIS
jgi:Poly(ADP-ribose) polymerase catalytic domain.